VIPTLPPKAVELIAKCLAGTTQERSHAWARPNGSDGRMAWFRWSVRRVQGAQGVVEGAVVVSESLTAEKEAEQHRDETAARLRDYLETASHWTWELDERLVLTHVSEAARSSGYVPERMRGQTLWGQMGIGDPGAHPRWRALLPDLQAHRPFQGFVYPFERDDGRRWVEIAGKPVTDRHGGFRGYRGSSRDVTERVEAEEERERQTEQLRLASLIAKIGYWQYDPSTRQVFLSPALQGLLRYEPISLPTRAERLARLIEPSELERVGALTQTAIAEQRPFELECRMLRADGTLMSAAIRSTVRRVDGTPIYVGIVQDVSDIVEARMALEHKSRENDIFRAMIEALPDLIFAKDREGRFLAANGAVARAMRAGSVSGMLGRTDFDFYPRALAERYRRDEEAMIASGEVTIMEQPAWLPDGTEGWLCSLKAPFHDAEGQLVGYVGHGRDISDEKAAAAEIERLSAEAARARDLLSEATAVLPDGFALFDPEDRLAACNDAFAGNYGLPGARLLGLTFEELQRLPFIRTRLAMEDAPFEAWLVDRLARHHLADGVPYQNWIAGTAHYVRERRTRDGWIVLLRADLTQLKRIEAELRSRNSQLAQLTADLALSNEEVEAARDLMRDTMDNVAQSVVVLDGIRRVAAWNPRFAAMCRPHGLQIEVGVDLERLAEHRLLPCPADELVRLAVAEWTRNDGTVWEVFARLTPSDNLVVTYTDISERRRVDQLKQEFISTVSHELRTPLTSIKGALGLLVAGRAGQLPDGLVRLVELAHRNADRLVRLVNDILDVEKLSAGQMQFEFKVIDVKGLVQQCIEANEAYAERGEVRLRLRPDANSAEVLADPHRLHQVLTNIIGNATKFSPAGETVGVGIQLDEDQDHVRVSVEDHGPGIPDAFRPRIFERFAQADGSDGRPKGGSGLGLYIARRIVEHHDGRIGFISSPGAGATFWIELPVRRAALGREPALHT
jgi:PAS domain S-box-containing protein